MICNKCGAALPDKAKFCVKCGNKIGAPLQAAPAIQEGKNCGKCGAPLKEDALFCISCGARIAETEPDTRNENSSDDHTGNAVQPQAENIPEKREEATVSTDEEISETKSEEVSETAPDIIPEDTSNEVSEVLPEEQSEETSETPSEEASGEISDAETDLQDKSGYKLLDIKIDDSKDINVLHKRAFVYLEDEKYDEAYTYFEHFLDNDPEDAVAFYGRLMLELGFKSEEEFETLDIDIKDNKNFKRAYKYGDDILREKLDRYAGNAAYSIFVKKLDELDDVEDIEKLKSEIEDNEPVREKMYAACDKKRDAILEEGYQQALELKNKIQTAKQAKQACLKFKSLGDYKDAQIYSNECAGIEARIISEQQQKQQSAAHIKNNFSSDYAEKTVALESVDAPNVPNPNAPRPNGQNPNVPNPNAPRPNGQNPNVPNPNAPRPSGQNPNVSNPNAPRPNGQNRNMPVPNAPKPNAQKKNVQRPDQPANNGSNAAPADKGGKKSGRSLIIILVTAIVLLIAAGTAVFFVFRAMNDFDEEKAKNGYFDFLPDMTIGEILDVTHIDPEGENEDGEKPLWSRSAGLSGCTVEFKGKNIYDDTSVLIRFAKGKGENPEIKYAELDGKKANIVALEVYIEDVYDRYSAESKPKVTETVRTTVKTEATSKTTTTTLSAEQLNEQKSLDHIGKCISDIKSEYGEPESITSKKDGARTYGIYKYGAIGFEYVKEDTSDTPSELMITNDTLICGVYYDQSAYISENYHVGMTYKELAGLISFEKNVPEYDDAEGKMIAKGNVKSRKYSAKVIFEDVAGMKSGTKGTAEQKSKSVYIHDKDIADIYVDSYRAAAKKAVKKDNAFKGVIKIDDGYLNVRETPGMNGKVIGELHKNDEVTVEEVSGEWYKVTKGDLKGYVSGEYLECALKKYLETAYASYKTYGAYNIIAFYDIDKDGTTEMILEEGTCEADSVYKIYTVEGSQVKYAGSAGASHATLYESDDGKLVSQMIHMGCEVVNRIELIDGVVVETELYSATSEIDEFSDPGTAVKSKSLGEIFGN